MRSRMTCVLLCVLAILHGVLSVSFAQDSPQPLSIEDAVSTALAGNLTLQAARADTASAKARITAAKSAEYPSVGITGVYSHTAAMVLPISEPHMIPSGLDVPSRSFASALVVARMSVYTGGRLQANVSINEALYDASLAKLGAAENQVAFLTRQAYSALLLSGSLVLAAQKGLDAAKGQRELAQSRFDAGTAARFDVLRAQTQVAEAEQTLLQANNQVETARMSLNRVLGAPLDKRYKLARPVLADEKLEETAALVKLADEQRPEILAARAHLAAARTGIRLARSQKLPQLTVMSGYQIMNDNAPADMSGAIVSALLTIPLISGGKANADVKDARSMVEAAQANLADVQRMIEQEVSQARLDIQTAKAVRMTAESRLFLATEAHDIAVVRYKSGLGTAVEVADAIASLTGAQTNMDKAISGYEIAYAVLQKAIGKSQF